MVAHDTSDTVLPPVMSIAGKKKNKAPLSAAQDWDHLLICVNTECKQKDPTFFNLPAAITSLQTKREKPGGLAFDR